MSRSTLNPELLWIGRDFCYRLNPLSDEFESSRQQQQHHQQLRPVGQLEEEEEAEDCNTSESCQQPQQRRVDCRDEVEDQLIGCQIETLRAGGGGGGVGGFRMSLPVPAAFHKFLIGRHGDTKRRLEAETGAELRIPRMGDTESPVLVLAKTRAQLASAKTQLDLLLDSARDRLPITHFLSLCVASECVVARYREFRDSALKWCGGDRGVTEQVFQRPARLHVTCVPLLLLTSQEVARARRMLDEFAADEMPRLLASMGSGPISVSLRGLEIMNDDPSETRVLYARMSDPTGRLQSLADSLAVKFAPLARAQPGREGVKLHVTLMNAKYASDEFQGQRTAAFDASHLLRKFGDFDLGSTTVDRLQLSKSAGGAPKDVYYPCEHSAAIA